MKCEQYIEFDNANIVLGGGGNGFEIESCGKRECDVFLLLLL